MVSIMMDTQSKFTNAVLDSRKTARFMESSDKRWRETKKDANKWLLILYKYVIPRHKFSLERGISPFNNEDGLFTAANGLKECC
jgi:hypothetical protein